MDEQIVCSGIAVMLDGFDNVERYVFAIRASGGVIDPVKYRHSSVRFAEWVEP